MDFMGQVEKTVNLVAKKANEVKEISKIKYSVYDLNNDVKKLYSEIGKSVFEELRESMALTEDIRMKCEILEAKLAKIEALKEKEKAVRSAKGMLRCAVCGEDCAEDLNFCPVCGASLAEEFEGEVSGSADGTGREQL